MPNGGGRDHEGRVRDLRGTGTGALALTRAGGRFGQPRRRAQGGAGAQVGRGERLLAVLFLPPYSPDFSPIEEAFSKVKALLRTAAARTREGLVEAIGMALSAVTPEDVMGFFGHCGYLPAAQPS
jgi:hypothetical protein